MAGTNHGIQDLKRLILVSIGITMLLILCTLDDLLSLHEGKADYASRTASLYLNIETSKSLAGVDGHRFGADIAQA